MLARTPPFLINKVSGPSKCSVESYIKGHFPSHCNWHQPHKQLRPNLFQTGMAPNRHCKGHYICLCSYKFSPITFSHQLLLSLAIIPLQTSISAITHSHLLKPPFHAMLQQLISRLLDWSGKFGLHQASFDHVKVGPKPVLELHNLWRQIHIFLDILEFRVKTKQKYLEKTVMVMLSQTCGKIKYIVRKIT